jgi:hypothetical protein
MKKLVVLLLMISILLAACVNTAMIWGSDHTYKALDIVLVSNGETYLSYASLSDGNKGNYPPDSPVWWGK